MRLTAEQLAIVASSGDVYVRACPGAGKTGTLVELAIRATEGAPRSGVAFLSFTNAAAAEVRERLSMRAPRLLRPPSFVGTFDSFLIRHVLGPDGLRCAPGVRVQFRESWGERIGFTVLKGGIPLDVFVPDGRRVRLDDARAGRDYPARAGLQRMDNATRKTLEEQAQRRIGAALGKGIATAPFLRSEAAHRLKESITAARAAARFAFVLVDEAQDCDALDLQIVTSLRDASCRCIVVSDPEQGIFRWRGADPAALGTLGHAELPLTGNFRSTISICAASSSLRASPLPPDTPMGEDRRDRPVALIIYDSEVGTDISEAFAGLLEAHRIPPGNAIVVAHREDIARRAVGAEKVRASTGNGAVIARAVATTASASDRAAGVELIEEVLAGSLGNTVPREPAARWCRTTARQVLGTVAAGDLNRGACARTREALATVRPPNSDAFVEEPQKRFKARDPKGPSPSGTLRTPALRCSTVHGVKGREFDAVLVVIPSDSHLGELINAWHERDGSHEGRAVMYVAATRARHVLAFAVPRSVSAAVAGLLRSQGAEVVEINC